MRMPNFLLIGAPKAATTSVWACLKRHPQIFMTEPKEPYFFTFVGRWDFFPPPSRSDYPDDHYFKCAIRRYGSLESVVPKTFHEYEKLFEGANNELAIGEASIGYLGNHYSREQIKRYIPDAKLIIVLRNPIHRIYSDYLHSWRIGWEPLGDFEKALDDIPRRKEKGWYLPDYYFEDGLYYKHISSLLREFPTNDIKISFFDDFQTDPRAFMEDLFAFLGVDRNVAVDHDYKCNIYQDYKGDWARQLDALTRNRFIRQVFATMLPIRVKEKIKGLSGKLLITTRKPAMKDATKKMLKEYYREDIIALENLTQRDLSSWRE